MKRGLTIGIVAVIAGCAVAFGVHHEMRRTAQMRAAVDSAFVQNRNYVPFTSDSTLREVAAYFDHPLHFWITANDRLRAHYALGCVYRDLHDAPVALLTWEDAIAAADTTAADCDFATLFRVYGQMASIYFRQSMPEKHLEAQNKLCHYALLAGDTLNYIRGLLLRNDAFLALGDTAAIYSNIANVRQLYLQRGLKAEAAQVYPTAIQIAIDRQQFVRADSMMQVFEQESELLSEGGTIAQGYERYYYNKGMYYLGVGQPDSAELQFRKLLQCEPALTDAYRGLLSLYRQKSDADSVFKYARLYEDALARYLKRTHIQSVDLAKGMYDYSLQQQSAQLQRQKAHLLQIAMLLFVMSTGMGIVFTYMRYRGKKKVEEIKQRTLLEKYVQAKKELHATRKEICLIKRTASCEQQVLLKAKNDKIETLKSLIKDLQKQINGEVPEAGGRIIDLIRQFHEMAHPQFTTNKKTGEQEVLRARAAKKSEWNELSKAIKMNHPYLYYYLSIEHHLTSREYQVCILSYLNFEIVEMATILNTSKQIVTNTRASAARKLFGVDKASILTEKLKKLQ